MSRNHKRWAGTIAVAGAISLAACADTASGPVNLLNSSEHFNLVTGTLDGIPEGAIQICKVAAGGGANGVNFTFTVTRNGADITGGNNVTVATGQCVNVANAATANGSNTDAVVVTELAEPANWNLTAITATRYQAAAGSPSNTGSDAVDLANQRATVNFNNDLAARVTFTNTFTPPPPPTGNNGCTPGYWKQPHHFDSWDASYDPTDSFNATFGIGTNWFPNSFTLLDGLSIGGGQYKALARHAVAALLNAAEGFYPLTEAQVIAAVQAAYANSALIESTKNTFEDGNELGCPLN